MNETIFWKNLVALCKSEALAPSYLTKHELNLSASSANKWKDGAMPKASTMRKIADYFKVPEEALVADPPMSSKDEIAYYKKVYREMYDSVGEYEEKKPSHVRIPVLGRVAAGIPIEQIVDIEDYEEISDELAKNGKYFALKIHGNSMEPRMCEGDVIIVRQQNTIENGEIAVVSVNGLDATCKKVEYTDDGLLLISLNPAYAPMKFTKEQVEQLPITILGRVVEFRAKI